MTRTPHTIPNREDARRCMARARRIVVRIAGAGFTLAELLVAVGVVAILTLGIGRIFASVTKLVGTGAAVGEVDQIARVIENQLRADFEAASRLGAKENFLAIRNRRVGDINNNGAFDADEVDIYLTRDDEEADQRRNVDPYKKSTVGTKPAISKAISVRLDQIMFLGASPEGYRSFQPPPASEQVVPHALIMWGHALRPPVDAEAASQDRPPYRLNYPDGDFGFARGDENPFAPDDCQFPTGSEVTGRNRYAGDFVLARQAILLAGSVAGGEERVIDGGRQTPLWGKDTEVALYPRDIEAAYLFEQDPANNICFKDYEDPDAEALSDGDGGPDGWGGVDLLPNPRLIRHGRTDILAVDREGLQRWLEGTGVPFSAGRLGDPSITTPFVLNQIAPNCRLWAPRDGSGVFPSTGPLRNQYNDNLRGIQSAIAGMFHRVLIESEPPNMRIDPEDTDTGYPDPALSNFAKPDPRDKRMDMAAIMASHCSSFEVAWSDGSTWFKDQTLRLDVNSDGKIDREIRRGDTIWFDMDFTVRDFWRLNKVGDDGASVINQNASVYPRPNPDPEIGLTSDRVFDWMPNRFPGAVRTNQTHINALEYLDTNKIDEDPDTLPAYCPKWNAMPFAPADSPQPQPEQEYLAIWGFQMPEAADQGSNPASVGGYQGAWTKPQLIRIRMTLHDSQNRLEGGKQFEFVFRLDGGRS